VLGLFLFMLALGFRRDEYTAPLLISLVAALAYLISPLFWKEPAKPSDK